MSAGDPESATMTVRLGAIASNYREAERRVGVSVAPVVKANAYSLGMSEVAGALHKAGADSFFVARLTEGMALRAVLPQARIFVLDGLAPGTAPALERHRLVPVLNSFEEIAEWSATARSGGRVLDAAIHIDTGMNRSGLSRHDVGRLAAERTVLAPLSLSLIMSHLACADEPDHPLNRLQRERFRLALAMLPPAPASLAASAGIELGPEFRFDMVRPGLGLYGGKPQPGRPNPYRTAVTLTGHVLQVRPVKEGETVGYGATFTAGRPSVLVTVALGYADGLLRSCAPRLRPALGGARLPFAGRMSMDLLVLDATGAPPEWVKRGVPVEFLGDTVTLEEVAAAAGTITHEALTSIAPRAPRAYVEI